jgi:acetoin utilization deacetylase AcuC-like enzyme
MTLLLRDPRFLLHETGPHVETPERLRSIETRLSERGLIDCCTTLPFEPITDTEVAKVHDRAVITTLSHIAATGGGHADPDTVICPKSPMVAHLASGACCAAVDAVLAGRDRTALCLVRPPGHHATPTHMMGFCLFNNIALATRHAIDKHDLSRVMIVDFDVHHGNGTQDIFYDDPRVMFLSIHRYGHGFYPGTGAHDETGTGPGVGWTRNVPLPYGTPHGVYFDAFTRALEQCADKSRPELVLISAGFDAHRRDPIGSLGLDTEDFTRLTELVLQVADVHCQGRVVSCLEGGYNLDALAESTAAHLEALLAP